MVKGHHQRTSPKENYIWEFLNQSQCFMFYDYIWCFLEPITAFYDFILLILKPSTAFYIL